MGQRRDYLDDKNAPRPNSLVPAAGGAVFDDQGGILLVKRFDNNKWALPGGQIEISESVVDTVKREIHEETGLDVSVESVIGVYSNPRHIIAYSDGETRRQFFILCKAVLIGGTIHTDSETSAAAFFSKEEALTLDLSPTQRQRIEDAYAAEIGGVVR